MEGIILQNIDKEKFISLLEKVEKIDKKLSQIFSDKNKEKISPDEAAEELGVTTQTIYTYIKKGVLPASKAGRKLLIKREDIEAVLREVKSLKYRRD